MNNPLLNSQVKIELHTPVGVFRGYTTKEEITAEQAQKVADYIQDTFNELTKLTLFINTSGQPDSEITFGKEALRRSVMVLRIIKW